MKRGFWLPKWTVAVAVAFLLLPLAVDWVSPGTGTDLAVRWLRGEGGIRSLPLWGWLVGLVGKDVAALGWISVCAALVCVWLVAHIAGAVFAAAVRQAKSGGVKDDEGNYLFVESVAAFVAGLAFLLAPGFLAAATRISPLMVVLVPPLAAAALVARVVFGSRTGADGGKSRSVFSRLRAGKGRLLLALGLIGYSVFETILARRIVWELAFPAVLWWLAVGVVPALVIAWCVRRRWIVGKLALAGVFGGWGALALTTGVATLASGRLDEGHAANRLGAKILAQAAEGGKVAVVSDGPLDGLYYFMLPEKMMLVALAREHDPAYGRELGEWVRRTVAESCADLAEDLAFAAGLGPSVLVDEWRKVDKAGFAARVASVANFFPTRETWDAACGELANMREDEPCAKYLRRLLGACGNALGCKMLEGGDRTGAWRTFRTIVDKVDPKNYAAFVNLQGMVERGHEVPKEEAEGLSGRRHQIEERFKSRGHLFAAARSGGRIYVDPEELVQYEKTVREEAAKRELSPEAKAFAEALAAASLDPEHGRAAREAIRKAIREGKVRADRIGGQLVAIDLALGDWENVERDAIAVLRVSRHDPTANAAMGALAGARGDYGRAERYLRRAVATGRASAAAKNDLAYTLCRRGCLEEAEALAREAVGSHGEYWPFRETLAAILIRRAKLEEGERELERAEALAEKAGLRKGAVVSLVLDRARLLKARGDAVHFRIAIRVLRGRQDLTAEQKAEVGELDR